MMIIAGRVTLFVTIVLLGLIVVLGVNLTKSGKWTPKIRW